MSAGYVAGDRLGDDGGVGGGEPVAMPSAHNFSPVQSIYRWRGEVHERREAGFAAYQPQPVPEIVARAKREHPYEVPGLSARPIADGIPTTLHGSQKKPDQVRSQ